MTWSFEEMQACGRGKQSALVQASTSSQDQVIAVCLDICILYYIKNICVCESTHETCGHCISTVSACHAACVIILSTLDCAKHNQNTMHLGPVL